MRTYRATAFNDQGLRFPFQFWHDNWNGIEVAAGKKLDEIVASDSLHQKNGPWKFRNIDAGLV